TLQEHRRRRAASVADPRGARGDRLARPPRRRDRLAGRWIRLFLEQLQSRDSVEAATRIRVQAVRLLGSPGERLHSRDGGQRRAARPRKRRARGGLATGEREWTIRGSHPFERSARTLAKLGLGA